MSTVTAAVKPILKLHETGLRMNFERKEYSMDSYKILESSTPLEIYNFFHPTNNPCLPADLMSEFFNRFRSTIDYMNNKKSMSTNFFIESKGVIYFVTYKYVDVRPPWLYLSKSASLTDNDPRSYYCDITVSDLYKDQKLLWGLNDQDRALPCFTGNDIIVPTFEVL